MRLTHLLSLVCAIAATEAFSQDIGWIEGIEGEASTTKLVRQGQNENIKPYVPLRAGDQIVISGQKTVVLVGTPEGKTQRITAAQSPFTMLSVGNTPTVSGNVLKWASGLFVGESKKNASQSMSAMSTRGAKSSPLTVPYLSKRFLLLAGKRALYLSWSGGEPPYRVRLLRQADGREILAVGEIKESSVVTPSIDLVEGDYILEILDASQTSYEDLLRVVTPNRQPIIPERQSLAQLPENTALLLSASWLGSTENGRWVIEAMQQLYSLSASFPAAKSVLQRLEKGAAVDSENPD